MLCKHLPGVLETMPVAESDKPTNVVIEPLRRQDKEAWFELHEAYSRAMGVDISPELRRRIWRWIDDPYCPLECLLVSIDGKHIGFVIFSQHPNPLTARFDGIVEALYIEPARRGKRVGHVVMEHIAEIGSYRGWSEITWNVGDKNYAARLLSDRVADKTTTNVFIMKPSASKGAA